MIYYITKNALTSGIFKTPQEYEVCSHIDDRMIGPEYHDGTYPVYYHKPDWHETKAEAIARAEVMRAAKIKTLEKSLAKLKAMNFEDNLS